MPMVDWQSFDFTFFVVLALDHSLLQSPTVAPLRTPIFTFYSNDYTYDAAESSTYHNRCGSDVERIVELYVDGKDFATGAPFLQAQLFFGMQPDVFGVSDFCLKDHFHTSKREDSGLYMLSSTLNDRIWDWVACESDLASPSSLKRLS